MQQQGEPKFLKDHQGSVHGVAFNPKDRYLFCSGGCDGKVNVYSALRMQILLCYQITTTSAARLVNAVRFTSDGSRDPGKAATCGALGYLNQRLSTFQAHTPPSNLPAAKMILAASTARRVVVLDVERGQHIMAYDNCAYSGRDRTGLASNPTCPNMAVSVAVNGKGLTLMDLRMPLPLDFVYDLHLGIIRDVSFLHSSWPWSNGQLTILSAGTDGGIKISTLDGRVVHQYSSQHQVNTVCASPESYNLAPDDAFYSVIMSGGDMVSSYVPDIGCQELLKEHEKQPVWKLRYTSNGSTLYTACEDGWLRRYRRYPDHHRYLGKVYAHKGDIYDMDVSPFDEYVITGSKDKTVGVLHLGSPSHGFTEFGQLT